MEFKFIKVNQKNIFIEDLLLFLILYSIFILMLLCIDYFNPILIGLILLSSFMIIRAPFFFQTIINLLSDYKFYYCVSNNKEGAPLLFRPYSEIKTFINHHKNIHTLIPKWFAIFSGRYDDKNEVIELFSSINYIVSIKELSKKYTLFFICFFFYHVVAGTLLALPIILILKNIIINKTTLISISFIILIIIYAIIIYSFVNNYFSKQIESVLKNLNSSRIESYLEEKSFELDRIVLLAKIHRNNSIEKISLNDLILQVEKLNDSFESTKNSIIQMSAPIIFVALTAVIIAISK